MAENALSDLLFLSLLLLPAGFNLCSCCRQIDRQAAEVNGLFVFGASKADNGNNNDIANSKAKANHLPYGMDFPLGPTGRFTNGKTIVDVLGELLKLPSHIPRFADHANNKGVNIIHGVNYASGASGILDETGVVVGGVVTTNQQITNFESVTLPQLANNLECSNVESFRSSGILSKYLFILVTGSNDYTLNNFLRPNSTTNGLEYFTANLISKTSEQIKRLYWLGGRKFVLVSINPLGCSPSVRSRQGCNEERNRAAVLFNDQLKSLVDGIKPQMPGSNLVYVDIYKPVMDIINYPTSIGFNNTGDPCCEVESIGTLCKSNGRTCADRSSYVFFDGEHFTEAMNVMLALKAYASKLTTEVYPINIQQLAQL